MLTALTLAASLTPDWRYVARSKELPGGGPAAVRSAETGEPVMVTCQRQTGYVIIAAGPSEAREARVRSGRHSWSPQLIRVEGGSSLLSIPAGSELLEGIASAGRGRFDRQRTGRLSGEAPRGLEVTYDDGRVSSIAPNEAVGRVIRECRSLTYHF